MTATDQVASAEQTAAAARTRLHEDLIDAGCDHDAVEQVLDALTGPLGYSVSVVRTRGHLTPQGIALHPLHVDSPAERLIGTHLRGPLHRPAARDREVGL